MTNNNNEVATEKQIEEALVKAKVYTKREIDCGVCFIEELAVDVEELTAENLAMLISLGGEVENGFVVFKDYEEDE